jgi:hypothetical protein
MESDNWHFLLACWLHKPKVHVDGEILRSHYFHDAFWELVAAE